jgi:hypothetical protein
MRLVLLAAVAVLLAPSVGLAQFPPPPDDFEDGLENWRYGLGLPTLVPDGGPTGAGDGHMRLTAGAGGTPRLTVFNRSQWLGNYIAAGVTAIEMDLLFTPTAGSPASLSMRIAYKSAITSQFDPGYSSTAPFTLPADGQWHHVVFPLTEATMTPVNGPTPFDTFMTSPLEMRILHSVAPDVNGDPVTAVVGVDNIQAIVTPIPEPAGVLAAAGAAAGLAGAVARRRGKVMCG